MEKTSIFLLTCSDGGNIFHITGPQGPVLRFAPHARTCGMRCWAGKSSAHPAGRPPSFTGAHPMFALIQAVPPPADAARDAARRPLARIGFVACAKCSGALVWNEALKVWMCPACQEAVDLPASVFPRSGVASRSFPRLLRCPLRRPACPVSSIAHARTPPSHGQGTGHFRLRNRVTAAPPP